MRRMLFSMFLWLFVAVSISAQTTAFTYQGSMRDGANPANGNFDFEFKLFDAVSAGAQQGSTQQRLNVAVANGVFAVSLDFGAGTLPGANRFLEIAVRTAGGGAFTTLAPRQQVNSAPYAVRSVNAANADNATSAANAANATTAATATNALQLGGVAAANYLPTNGNGSALTNLNAGNISAGTLAIANGGTGAANAANARINLGLGPISTVNPVGTPSSSTFLRGDNVWASPSEIVASINTQFSQDDRSNWTRIEVLPDDGCNPNVPLGFTFTGWGLNITTVGVNNNGFLIFGNTCPTAGSWNNVVLPSAITADPFVAFFWDDLLEAGAGEFIEYQTSGTAGGRVFNLYFRNRLLSTACGADAVNIMLAIHEGSNLVRISYSGMSGCAMMRGSSATFGMQGPGGASAKAFNAGTDSPILDNDANRNMISFIPPR